MREIADKTVLVGLTSTIFRGAKYTSHEVTVDDEQLSWFEDFVASKPAEEGWKLFVFTRVPRRALHRGVNSASSRLRV